MAGTNLVTPQIGLAHLKASFPWHQSSSYPSLQSPSCAQPPVLVLWGRQDRILPPETAEQFAKALPEATVTYLEKSGHSGHLEEPRLAADAIMEFVARCHATL